MKITLQNIGKRFNKEWIFRNLNYEFSLGNKYAILGTNGCGKSTLLQIIAGASSQSEGKIEYTPLTIDFSLIDRSNTSELASHLYVSLAAPYLELPEEMTWKEAVKFHRKFKKFVNGLTEERVMELSGLAASSEKEIRNFSSGMKQRAKLTLAILSETPLLLLDEPSTNLDIHGVKWYQSLIYEFSNKRLVIVCSNYNQDEYSFCNKELALSTLST